MVDTVLAITHEQNPVWRRLKQVHLSKEVPRFNDLKHKTVYGGAYVYGRAMRNETVFFITTVLNRSV